VQTKADSNERGECDGDEHDLSSIGHPKCAANL
jgi:hypothetical protein